MGQGGQANQYETRLSLRVDKVLVTGGQGMVGAAVCRALLTEGRQPVIADVHTDNTLIADVAHACIVEQADIRDLDRLHALARLHSPVAIVHLAGLVGPEVERDSARAIAVNLEGSVAVFECARQAGIARVVLMSSKMVYGPALPSYQHPYYQPVPESHPREPHKLYGKLKRAVEDIADHYGKAYGLDMVALRCGATYGPGKFGRNDKVSPVMGLIEAAFHGRPFQVAVGAQQGDDLCYIAEVGNGIMAVLNAPARPGGLRCYNISSGLITLGEVAQTLREIFPSADLDVGPGLDYRGYGGLGYYFQLAIDRAQQDLGFVVRYPFRVAVQDYCASLQRLYA